MTIDPVQYARRWKTLGVLSLSLVIIGLDTTILNVALPTLQDEFDASPSKLQWMVDSYLLVFAGLLLVFGTLGDRFGRKLALQAGVTIFGLAESLLIGRSRRRPRGPWLSPRVVWALGDASSPRRRGRSLHREVNPIKGVPTDDDRSRPVRPSMEDARRACR